MTGQSFDRRRFLRGLGLGAAALGGARVLAACGGGSSGLSGDQGGGQASGGASGPKPTLNVWYHQYGESGTQQAVTRYAKEYPDATVKVQWTPGDYTSKLNAGLLSTSGPDVFESNLNIDQVKSGQVVDLDDIIADVKSDYTEADIKSSTVDGKIYQIKMVDDMGVLYYRKSILDKAGVKPPTTIDELIAASKALNTKDQKGLFIGNDAGVTPSFGGGSLLGTILWTVGADSPTADNKPGFTTPEVKQSFAKMRELFLSKSILLGAPTDWWDPSSFTQGWRRCSGAAYGPCRGSRRPSPTTSASWPGRLSAPASENRPHSPAAGVPWLAPSRPMSMPPKPSSSGCGSTTPRTKRTSTSVTASISRLASRWPRQRPSCSLARPRTPSRSSTRTPSRPTPPGHPR